MAPSLSHFPRVECSRPAFYKIVLLLLIIFCHQPTLLWVVEKCRLWRDATFVILALILALVWACLNARWGESIHASKSAMILLGLSVGGSLLNSLTISAPQVDLMLLILGMYGALGFNRALWPAWAKRFNIVLLLAFAIPYYLEFSSGFGFSLRLMSAWLVEQTLIVSGVHAVSSLDIIVTENSIAHIDTPCSGLKSIWVGSGFFFGALLIIGRKLSGIVILEYGFFLFLIITTNLFRILILTLLKCVWHLPTLAEILHLPLGIFGFTLSCCIAWILLMQTGPSEVENKATGAIASDHWFWPFFGIISLLSLGQFQLNFWSQVTPLAQIEMDLAVPANFQLQPLPLTEQEGRYFSRSEQTLARKWAFDLENISGSVLWVQSRDLNMIHAPELCLIGTGISVDKMESIRLNGNLQIREMALNGGKATGLYWLQSGTYTTDSFGDRYWRFLWLKQKKWNLVSMTVDHPWPLSTLELQKIIDPFYNSVSGK